MLPGFPGLAGRLAAKQAKEAEKTAKKQSKAEAKAAGKRRNQRKKEWTSAGFSDILRGIRRTAKKPGMDAYASREQNPYVCERQKDKGMKIYGTKTNHLTNPMGYQMDGVSFSWKVADASGKKQTWARIRAAADEAMEQILFDSGKDELADSLAYHVNSELKPRTRYFWTVTVHTDADEEAVSDVQWFETGKRDEPWTGQWIGVPEDYDAARHPVFEKKITPAGPVRGARLYISGLGLYEAAYNGEKIGAEYLTPYCDNYNACVQYQTHDVTAQLQAAGTLSVTLGDGWYKGRFGFDDRTGKGFYGDAWKLIAELHLLYEDGTEDVIGTDESWTVRASNLVFSNIYDGEQRDDSLPQARILQAVKTDAPAGKLMDRISTPVTVREEVPVKEVIHTPAGETVLDLGQELTGIFRLNVPALPAGSRVHLQFGEILQDGNFYRENLRTAKAEYIYTSGGAAHIIEPKFTFYGYRYVKIEGLEEIKARDFTALVLHSEIEKTGEAVTGNDLVNRLLQNIDWGLRGNFLDVPTDCPQRDERMGWTGDAQVFAPTANSFRDCCAFYRKYLYDLKTEQDAQGNGAVPDVIPSFGKNNTSAAWGDAACVIPWVLYQYCGDASILEEQYESMCGWVSYIKSVDGDDHGWRRKFHYGDWLALDASKPEQLQGGTEVGFVADVMYLKCVRIAADAAGVLGKTEDEAAFKALSADLLREIRSEYFTPSGRAAVTTQTGLLLAYRYGLSPDPDRIRAQLEARMKEDDGHLKTGFVGTPLLLPVLSDCGLNDMAYDLLLYEDYPGWLYEVKMGATTVWERWNSVGPDGKIAENGMNSLNHYSYGSVAEWICAYAAGLHCAAPGFKKAKIAPEISADLGKISYAFDSASGLWKSAWEILENGDISCVCTVPFGCSAVLKLPCGGGEHVLAAGEFSLTYTPDTPLKTTFTVDTPLGDLMENPKARALLTRAMPRITQLPPSMNGMSIRQVMARMGGANGEMLEKINAMLKTV